MDLTQLADLGEFIGGVAVLVTLVYLALQVRQTTAAQERTSALAAASAIDASVDRWSLFREMLADHNTGAVWVKALRDEPLCAEEVLRVRAVLQQLAYSAVATSETWRATGNEEYLEGLAPSVAVELRGSESLRKAWQMMAEELAVLGLSGFASAVASHLEDPTPSPSASKWLTSLAPGQTAS